MVAHLPSVLFANAAIVSFLQSFWRFLLARVNTRIQQESATVAKIVQQPGTASLAPLAPLTNEGENEELLEVTCNLLIQLLQERFVAARAWREA